MFNIGNWKIQIIEENCLDTNGRCYTLYNEYQAVIKIRADLNEVEKEKTLIHELIHIVRRDEYDLCSDVIKDDQMNKLYTRFHERSVEQLANVIYDLAHKTE